MIQLWFRLLKPHHKFFAFSISPLPVTAEISQLLYSFSLHQFNRTQAAADGCLGVADVSAITS